MFKKKSAKFIFLLFLIVTLIYIPKIYFVEKYTKEIDITTLETLLSAEENVFILFEKDDCQYCAEVKQTIKPLLKENVINLKSIDAEKFKEVKDLYNLTVVPTIIYFKNGKEVDRIEGAKQLDYYEYEFADWIKK